MWVSYEATAKAVEYITISMMSFQLLYFHVMTEFENIFFFFCLRFDFLEKKHEKKVQVQIKWEGDTLRA